MKNVDMNIENDGKTLTITVDLTKRFGASKSGKTQIIATTNGNEFISKNDAGEQLYIGLNIFAYPVKGLS